MLKITVDKNLNAKFKALLCFAPKKDIRYYLNGVCLDVSGGTLRGVATDGYMLGVTVLGQVDAPDMQIILPGEFVERIVKTKDAFELTASAAAVSASHGHSCAPIDGKYPDWRRVAFIPTGEPAIANFDADLLARIAKASRALGNTHGHFVMTQYGESGAPFQIADDFAGVVMPLRIAKAGQLDKVAFCKVTK